MLCLLMAAAATAVAAPGVLRAPGSAVPTPIWWAMLPVFALTEVVVIHLPTQRSSHSHTLREIPAIAGLTFLVPQQYVTAYVIGGGLALVLWSRQRGLKLTFNLSMFALEAALRCAVYHAVLRAGDPISPRAWAAVVVAVLITDLVSAAAVTAVISLTENTFDSGVLKEALRSGIPATLVNACVALLLVTLIVVRPGSLPLLGFVVILLVLGYRTYVSLVRDHAQMQLLYQFVGSTGRTAELEEVIPAVLREAAQLLQASTARLVTDGPDHASGESWTWRAGAVTRETWCADGAAGPLWWEPALRGEPVLHRYDGAARSELPETPRDGIAVPLGGDGAGNGALMVHDRAFEQETFSPADLRVFEALAAHAQVALDKARVVERLRGVADERAHEALHDALTGLPNRRALHDAVGEAMLTDRPCAVLLLDLDDFKDVNDTLGHSAGDGLLTVTGRRIQASGAGLVARLGGDEFAVLLHDTGVAEAMTVAGALRAAVHQPVPLQQVELITTASIGVTGFRGASSTPDEVLAEADVAMYAAKAARSGVQAYRPEDGSSTARRLRLAADLRSGLEQRTLELWFQPQARACTGEITGFEALLRWSHPELGMVPPPEIVAVAQRTGLMPALTDWILQQALAARATWAVRGHDLDVSVNVTPRDVADVTLVDRVARVLEATGTPPGALVLEITESDAMGDPERCLAVLTALAERGVRLSVDDFGTGYSSLAYLDRLPVHEVKIDQSFVFRLEKEAADSTIVRATVTLAHDLGLRVVAEGVESDLARGAGRGDGVRPAAGLRAGTTHAGGRGRGVAGSPGGAPRPVPHDGPGAAAPPRRMGSRRPLRTTVEHIPRAPSHPFRLNRCTGPAVIAHRYLPEPSGSLRPAIRANTFSPAGTERIRGAFTWHSASTWYWWTTSTAATPTRPSGFALDGVDYEIDLSEKHAEDLRNALSLYVGHGRRTGGRRRSTKRPAAPAGTSADGGTSAADIRAWARENGWDVPERGRVSAEVRDAYAAAN